MAVFLLGYRGCGKSTVGRRLASRLWQDFHDTDVLVERAAGMSIAELWRSSGEAAFRALEARIVQDLIRLDEGVVALGGGSVLDVHTRDALKASAHKRIYLRCEVDELVRRLAADPNTARTRPSLTGGDAAGSEEVRQVLAVREPIYREVMTAELDVTRLTPDEAVVYIVRLL
ncbi:MAG: shikimate kinase [Tepidisphaerales bacterium]